MTKTEKTKTSCESPRLGFLEITVLVLSVYVLGAMLAQVVFQIPPAVSDLLDRIDFLICVVFLFDFAIRFRRAPSKLRFMKWGWLDLISSIPAYDFLRWGRTVRLIRIIRILRAFRSARHLVAFLYRHRTRSIALTAVLTAFVLVVFSSVAVLAFEHEKESNIKTPLDAVWWAVSTMTTVGYGDRYPVSVEGKLVAMLLMVVGVGLFGVLTGLFARIFVDPNIKREDNDIKSLAEETRKLRELVERLEARLSPTKDDADIVAEQKKRD